MKKNLSLTNFLLLLIALPLFGLIAFTIKQQTDNGYILEHEADIKKEEPGPHNGGGNTTAFSFFSNDKTVKVVFRKRILHPGSAIGYHLQEKPEIYYILSGNGILKMNGKDIPVTAGDAILTKPGSRHGLKQIGDKDLAMLTTYDN